MSDARDKIVERASRLFLQQGYHGTSLSQIMQADGEGCPALPRGSLYYYFPEGKEQLAAAAVEYRGRQTTTGVHRALQGFDHPAQALLALVGEMATQMVKREFRNGASVGGLAMESSTTSEVLRQACAEVYDLLTAELAALLPMLPPAEAQSRALAMLAALEGALVICYTNRRTDALIHVGELLARDLEELG